MPNETALKDICHRRQCWHRDPGYCHAHYCPCCQCHYHCTTRLIWSVRLWTQQMTRTLLPAGGVPRATLKAGVLTRTPGVLACHGRWRQMGSCGWRWRCLIDSYDFQVFYGTENVWLQSTSILCNWVSGVIATLSLPFCLSQNCDGNFGWQRLIRCSDFHGHVMKINTISFECAYSE